MHIIILATLTRLVALITTELTALTEKFMWKSIIGQAIYITAEAICTVLEWSTLKKVSMV